MVCEDWVDGSLDLLREAARDPRCRAILKQQYRAESFPKALRSKVHPWTYTSSFPGKLQPLLAALRREPRTRAGLYFRGKVKHAGRADLLTRLAAKGLLASDPAPVPFGRYCAEVSRQRLVLGLPGWGNLCHREFEAFGIGTPVLMPRLRNRLHNDLVPDRHYIGIEVDPDRDGLDRAADAIERRYREVAEDTALLERVAAEAMAWYDANAAVPACLRLTVELLERRGLPR